MRTKIGTMPCPQITNSGWDNGQTTKIKCGITADIFDCGPDADENEIYESECSDGHVQSFGAYVLSDPYFEVELD